MGLLDGLFKREQRDVAEVVREKVAVLRDELEANHREDTGTLNRPRYQRTLADLRKMGSEAVPVLLEIMAQPRRPTVTAAGEDDLDAQFDQGVAEDVAEVLGDIGDPRSVPGLRAQLSGYLSVPPRALANFPEGLECLLEAQDDPNVLVRAQVASGLGFPYGEHDRAADGLAKALADESTHVRRNAAGSAINLRYKTPELQDALTKVARDDPDEGIRNMADRALRTS